MLSIDKLQVGHLIVNNTGKLARVLEICDDHIKVESMDADGLKGRIERERGWYRRWYTKEDWEKKNGPINITPMEKPSHHKCKNKKKIEELNWSIKELQQQNKELKKEIRQWKRDMKSAFRELARRI